MSDVTTLLTIVGGIAFVGGLLTTALGVFPLARAELLPRIMNWFRNRSGGHPVAHSQDT